MAVEWYEASDDVVMLAEQIINEHHPHLLDAKIGFLFRSEAPVSNGRITYGMCKKLGKDMQVYLDYDFIIWLAYDKWMGLSDKQRRALVDHELCHAGMTGEAQDKPAILPHDIEEFNCILKRHGFWWPLGDLTVDAIQPHLPLELERRGKVSAVNIERIGRDFKRKMDATGLDWHMDAGESEPEPS